MPSQNIFVGVEATMGFCWHDKRKVQVMTSNPSLQLQEYLCQMISHPSLLPFLLRTMRDILFSYLNHELNMGYQLIIYKFLLQLI